MVPVDHPGSGWSGSSVVARIYYHRCYQVISGPTRSMSLDSARRLPETWPLTAVNPPLSSGVASTTLESASRCRRETAGVRRGMGSWNNVVGQLLGLLVA